MSDGTEKHRNMSARHSTAKMVYISTDYVFDGQGSDTVATGLQGLSSR